MTTGVDPRRNEKYVEPAGNSGARMAMETASSNCKAVPEALSIIGAPMS